jgi:hypothetical protein
MRSLVAVACALLLAGCAGAPRAQPPPEAPAPAVAPSGYALHCPVGGTDEGALCAGRLASLTESNQEPFAAADPWRPGVLAIGVNAGHTTEGLVLGDGQAGMDLVRLDVFVSADNGTTWAKRTLPPVPAPDSTLEPVQSTVVGDPAIAFAPDGAMHVSGIVTHSQARGYSVFYVSSPDLGETWNAPVILSTGDDNDRNWMNRGPDGALYVPWQRVGALSEVAWSLDGGSTWRAQGRGQVAKDCITVSEVVFPDGTPTLACAKPHDSGRFTVEVLSFDPMSGDLGELASLQMDCVWPKLSVTALGLVLTGEGCPGVEYAISKDGGRTWTKPAGIEGLAGREATGVLWQASDPWGRLHLVLGAGDLTYHVLDANGTLLEETLVAAASGLAPPSAPRTLAPPYGDHYYGISVASWGGLVSWTEDSTVRYTLVKPVW